MTCAMTLVRSVASAATISVSSPAVQRRRRGLVDDSGERPVQLDADFQVDLAVQVDRNMQPRTRDLLRANDVPDSTTGVRYDLRELMGGGATAHDRKPAAAVLLESDDVFNAKALCRRTW